MMLLREQSVFCSIVLSEWTLGHRYLKTHRSHWSGYVYPIRSVPSASSDV